MLNINPTPTVELSSEYLDQKGIRIWVKRDELNHPLVMGNKWRKLKYNLHHAQNQQKNVLVTYGGAFSNHILATAAAASEAGLKSVGIIRGDELNPNSNPTLATASKLGMELIFTSRTTFKTLKEKLTVPNELVKYPRDRIYILPEGGTNELAIRGCEEIIKEVNVPFDICCTAMGTGGTFLGILKSLNKKEHLLGFSALKGKWLAPEVKRMKEAYEIENENYRLFDDQMFGGYGRFDQNLIQFILDFRQEYGILLDPIYTGKMFFRVWDMMKNDQIAKGTRLLLIHTGGLQGIEGFNARFDQVLPLS